MPGAGVVGMGVALVLFFLRRRQKKIPRPMRARPTMGPTTAPAIQALLSLFCAGAAVPVPDASGAGDVVRGALLSGVMVVDAEELDDDDSIVRRC